MDARYALARKYATKYSLDIALVCALVEQESSWCPWAMRYEPQFYSHYIAPMVAAGNIHSATEATARATSYGLGQVMGQVAREFGFTGQFLSELCDPDVGLDLCCHKLQKCMAAHPSSVENALLAYNGGSDPTYPSSVLARMDKYYAVVIPGVAHP